LDKAGTYWYHPHLHENTNRQVSLGIAGFILVKDEEEARLNLPRVYGVDDFPLVIQTKDFDENNQVVVPSNKDDVVMVNATLKPFLEVPAQVVRLRLLNGSSQRTFNLGLSNNHTFYQVASDGGLLENPVELTRLRLSPGERAEILVDFIALEGATVYLKSFASELPNGIYGAAYPGMGFMMSLDGYNPNPLNGNDFEILELKVREKTENSILTIPDKLVEVKRLNPVDAQQNRSLSFNPTQMGPNQLNGDFLINGQHFDMDVINFSIPLNSIEVWSLTNQSGIAHPFHIHDVQFYVLDRNGITPPLNEKGRKDVVLVNPMETVRFITQFTDFANDSVPYMLHCHMLTHEDKGMMLQFEVVDKTTGINKNKQLQNSINVYPNPVKSGKSISVTGIYKEYVSFAVYSLSGQILINGETIAKNNTIEVDLKGIEPGTYFLKMLINNEVYSNPIIIVN
jgi:bilirubin oxidase